MCAALLTLLRRLAQEAVLIRIFSTVLADAAAVQGAEDRVRAVVSGQVFLVLCQLGFVVVELAGGAVELRFRGVDRFGFGTVGVRGREDAVLDESYAQVA